MGRNWSSWGMEVRYLSPVPTDEGFPPFFYPNTKQWSSVRREGYISLQFPNQICKCLYQFTSEVVLVQLRSLLDQIHWVHALTLLGILQLRVLFQKQSAIEIETEASVSLLLFTNRTVCAFGKKCTKDKLSQGNAYIIHEEFNLWLHQMYPFPHLTCQKKEGHNDEVVSKVIWHH